MAALGVWRLMNFVREDCVSMLDAFSFLEVMGPQDRRPAQRTVPSQDLMSKAGVMGP